MAEALRRWLPDVIQTIEPWMSAADIDAGARWNRQIEDELSITQVGILCLTNENQEAPWVLFEAGALAKTVADTLVCPFLIGIAATELRPGPLTRFQAKEATSDGTWELILTLNRALKENSLPEDRLRRSFERSWPDLAQAVANLPQPVENPTRRPVEDMVEEVLTLVRGLARRTSAVSTSDALVEYYSRLGDSSEDPVPDWVIQQYLNQLVQHQLLQRHITHFKPKESFGRALKEAAQNLGLSEADRKETDNDVVPPNADQDEFE